jgi:hypothetical protein
MAYVLEKMTQADQEKILKDAECDESKKQLLIKRKIFTRYSAGNEWAIDRDINSYLFWVHPPPRSEYRYYYFYFNDFLYALRFYSIADCLIHFDDSRLPDQSLLPEFKEAITEALSVYGVIYPSTKVSFEK